MIIARLPADEAERLAALRELEILDTPPEEGFDELVELASSLCEMPVALVTLVDFSRQWFKAKYGLDVIETPRDVAFCAHAILDSEPLLIPDAQQDDRFFDNPLVTGPPYVRSYAGVPIAGISGARFGTLCVVGYEPRYLTKSQIRALQILGNQVSARLELRRQTLHLARSQARLRALSDSAPVGVFQTDVEGLYTYTNTRWDTLTGFKPGEALGERWMQAIHPDDRDAVVVAWRHAVAGGKEFVLEYRFQSPSGRVSWVRGRATSIVAGTLGISGYVGTVDDITERKAADRAKSEFVATVSHELRTPLTSIRGALGLLDHGTAGILPPKAQELVHIARNNTDRLVRLVNDVLDIEKMDSGRLKVSTKLVDMWALVNITMQELAASAEQMGVTLMYGSGYKEGIVHQVMADADRIVQVLTNLIGNAIKFSPRGSHVVVGTKQQGDRARCFVQDFGPGIDSKDIERLFVRFQQLDSSDTRAKGGTGLGLAISKGIVEQHGGTIGVNSVAGEGSTFWFELPLVYAGNIESLAGNLRQ